VAQGTAFLRPALRRGRRYCFEIQIETKSGRMCYFIGAAPRTFDMEAGQAEIRRRAAALENLHAALHTVGQPCGQKGLPCFHAGSVVSVELDLASRTIRFGGLVGGEERVAPLKPAAEYVIFVSLYNRGAAFRITRAIDVTNE
jgi:hypothetical protein